MKRKSMDFAINAAFGIGALFLGIAATIYWSNGSKTLALWSGITGAILFLISVGVFGQQAINIAGAAKINQPVNGPSATEITANRAYVGFGNLTAVLLDSPSAGHVTAWIRLTNTGKTPAIRSKGWLLFKVDLNDKLPFAETRSFDSESTMAPGYEANLYSTQQISAAQLHAIEQEQISFFVWGRIEYEDVYGHPHFQNFQGRMNGPRGTIITEGRVAQGWGFKPFGSGTNSD